LTTTATLRTREYWIGKYQEKNAYWLHDGDEKRPHVILSGDLHSNGYFHSKPVITDESLLHEAACDLVARLSGWISLNLVDRVVGPERLLVQSVAEEITLSTGKVCWWSSMKKAGGGSDTSLEFADPARRPKRGERVWPLDDVITTGRTLEMIKEAVMREGARMLTSAGCIVNRSGSYRTGIFEIFANLDQPMPMWEPEKCPLCKRRSRALLPKVGDNWAALHAKY
jgi:orotate phosphoribosyltransferase